MKPLQRMDKLSARHVPQFDRAIKAPAGENLCTLARWAKSEGAGLPIVRSDRKMDRMTFIAPDVDEAGNVTHGPIGLARRHSMNNSHRLSKNTPPYLRIFQRAILHFDTVE